MAKENDPLMTAAGEGQADVVRKLLAKGVKPSAGPWTALHECSIDGHADVAELLLGHGLDPNARNESGSTPLLTAAGMFAGPAFFRVLLEHGADASVRDKDGKSALDEIFSRVDGQGQPLTKKRISICKLLMEHGAPAAPDQARRLGGVEAKAAKAKLATFDWPALEAHLLAASTKAIAAFAKRHTKDVFYGFCFDCNAEAHGAVSCCLNTVEALKDLEEEGGRASREAKWSPGDWAHQEFANIDSDPKWRKRVAPLGDENGLDQKVAARLLESIAQVALRLVETHAFSGLRCTDDFDVFVIDHDETYSKASARMKRARAVHGAAAKPADGKRKPTTPKLQPAIKTKGGASSRAGKRRFEFTGGGSSKFWEIEVRGSRHIVTFGRIGAAGQAKEKSFASAPLAHADAEKLIGEKTKKGYREA